MIVLVTLFFFIATVDLQMRPEVIVAWENYHIPHFDECVEEANVDPMIPRLMFRQLHLPDESEFHCYLKCIFQRNGWLTSDESDLDYVKLADAVHVTPELIDTCSKAAEGETEICRKTFIVTKCAIEENNM